jgi:organic radical activating enzyme
MNKLIEIKQQIDNIYLYWILTDFCNQSCSYCPPSLWNSQSFNKSKEGAYPTDEDFFIFADKFIALSKETGKKLIVEFSGGEPTTHHLLPALIEKIAEFGEIHITTNGTRNVSYWKQLKSLPKHFNISLHPEYYDKNKNRINELVKFLYVESKISLALILVCHPNMWDKFIEMLNDIDNDYQHLIDPRILFDLFDDGVENTRIGRLNYVYTDEQLDFVKKFQNDNYNKLKVASPCFTRSTIAVSKDNSESFTNATEITAEKNNYFFNWKCSAGSELFQINAAGICTAGLCEIRNLGTARTFEPLTEYISCNRISCLCYADIVANKYDSKFK